MQKIISLDVKPSIVFFTIVLIIHLLACCALLLSGLSWLIQAILIIIILSHCYYIYRNRGPIRLIYDRSKENKWLIKSLHSEWQLADLSSKTLCFRFYVLLVLRLKHTRRLIYVPLLPGDIRKNDFRRLRVLLRFYD